MKRYLIILAAVVSIFFFGCKKDTPKELVIATGGVSGVYYPLGCAIAEILNNSIDSIHVTVRETGGSAENIRLMGKGEAQLAIVQNDIMDYAYRGIFMFPERFQNISTIATLYPEVIQIVASKESGIKSIEDLRGKRVSIGDVGSGGEFNAKQILEGYGIQLDEIQKYNLSFKESADKIKNGEIDACFLTSGIPNKAVEELTKSTEIELIPIIGTQADKICNAYNFYTKTVIPPRTYEGIHSGTPALSIRATLAANSELDEELIYEMTEALFDNLTELGKAHIKGKEVSQKTAVTGVSVPFHTGAIKYYSDKGLTIF